MTSHSNGRGAASKVASLLDTTPSGGAAIDARMSPLFTSTVSNAPAATSGAVVCTIATPRATHKAAWALSASPTRVIVLSCAESDR